MYPNRIKSGLDMKGSCLWVGLMDWYIQNIKLIKGSNPHMIFNSSYEKRFFIIYLCFLFYINQFFLRTKLLSFIFLK